MKDRYKWRLGNFLITSGGIVFLVTGTRYWDIVSHDWKGILCMILGIIFIVLGSLEEKNGTIHNRNE